MAPGRGFIYRAKAPVFTSRRPGFRIVGMLLWVAGQGVVELSDGFTNVTLQACNWRVEEA